MIRAILFDMGGTLDGDGVHWLERFLALYQSFGAALPRETIREAFDEAERKSAQDETIASSNLSEMIALHVKWQLAHLGLGEEEAPVLVVTPVDRHADVVQHRGGTV
jgi:putative hydrolase of the HAD superfamily